MNTFYQLWGVQTPMEAEIKLEEQRHPYRIITNPQNLEEQALKICGSDIYYRLIKGYTEKQWGRAATKLPAFIVKRIPFRFTFDNNYFNDPYQGIPIGGYNRLINALLEGIEVKTNINYLENRNKWDSIAEKYFLQGALMNISIFVMENLNIEVYDLKLTALMIYPTIREMQLLIIVTAIFHTHV